MLDRIEKNLELIESIAKNGGNVLIEFMRLFKNDKSWENEKEDATIVARALDRLQSGKAPRIAVVGMTCAGKSTLINALFGSHALETKATPDTTKSIHKISFNSGLVIYDTPGIFGNALLENITRAFIGINQISEKGAEINHIPFRDDNGSEGNISINEIKERAPIDIVLWVGDLSRTLSRGDKKELKEFSQELQSFYKGRTIIAGSKLDLLKALDGLTEDEKTDIIKAWDEITEGLAIPVSPISGEGLDRLVLNFFQSAAHNLSLNRLQESLNTIRKLNRTTFVAAQISEIMARMVLLNAEKEKELKASSILLYALIGNQYSVDEDIWKQYNGDALEIGNHVKRLGIQTTWKPRSPSTFWERFWAFFGRKYYDQETKYKPIGFEGFAVILPKVLELIFEFEKPQSTVSQINFDILLASYKDAIEKCVSKKDTSKLNKIFTEIILKNIN